MNKTFSVLLFSLVSVSGILALTPRLLAHVRSAKTVEVTISRGYDTTEVDRGRPVILIASALGVPEKVFREAFTHVSPARGTEPTPDQVHRNKDALLKALGPYGVTNDRLDTVSDYYRYNPSRDEVWRRTPAAATAYVTDSVVTSIKVNNAGAGYTSEPKLSIPGYPSVRLKATLTYTKSFSTNGSITEIKILP